MKRSELCELRYLRNVNSRRNGTCKEDNIVYTHICTLPWSYSRVPTSSSSIFVTFFFYFSLPSSFPFTRASHRSGMVPHKIPITFSIGFNIESVIRNCCNTNDHGTLIKLCFLFGWVPCARLAWKYFIRFGFIISTYRYLFLEIKPTNFLGCRKNMICKYHLICKYWTRFIITHVKSWYIYS